MRRQPDRKYDTTPNLKKCGCGGNAKVVYDAPSRIVCTRCGSEAAAKTMPFFRDSARQREHEAWRTAVTWNEGIIPQ